MIQKSLYVLVWIILIHGQLIAQNRNKPNRFSRNFQQEVSTLEEQLKSKVHPEDAKAIASSLGYYDHLVYRENTLIQDQIDLENKIITIANRMIETQKLKVPSKIKRVYITKQTNFNCSVTQQGTIYVNLGLLAEVENEAALAAIIGHEIAHYYNEDVLKANIKAFNENRENKGKKIYEKKWDFETKTQNANYSQAQESNADSIGAVMAHKTGYDLRSGQNNFLTFLYTEQESSDANIRSGIGFVSKSGSGKEKINSIIKDVLSSHPENYDRYQAFDRYIAKLGPNSNKLFDVFSENEFQKINTWAREKLISRLLIETEYQKCLEKSFLFHLFDDKNMNYISGILESSRVLMKISPSKAKQGFLSEKYNSSVLGKGQGILSNLKAFVLDSVKYSRIKNKSLLNNSNIAFTTYDDAFNYYADIAITDNCTECLLSIALRNSDVPELKKEFLQKYLDSPKALRKQYAKAYLNNQLNEEAKKGTKNLLVLDKLYTYSRGNNLLYVSEINTEDKLIEFEQEISQYRDPSVCDLYVINESSFNNNKEFLELNDKIDIARNLKSGPIDFYERGNSKYFWELSPALWELYAVKGYKEIYVQKYMNISGNRGIVLSFIPLALSLFYSSNPMKNNLGMVFSRSTCMGINKKDDMMTYKDEFGYAIEKINPVYLLNTVYGIIR